MNTFGKTSPRKTRLRLYCHVADECSWDTVKDLICFWTSRGYQSQTVPEMAFSVFISLLGLLRFTQIGDFMHVNICHFDVTDALNFVIKFFKNSMWNAHDCTKEVGLGAIFCIFIIHVARFYAYLRIILKGGGGENRKKKTKLDMLSSTENVQANSSL